MSSCFVPSTKALKRYDRFCKELGVSEIRANLRERVESMDQMSETSDLLTCFEGALRLLDEYIIACDKKRDEGECNWVLSGLANERLGFLNQTWDGYKKLKRKLGPNALEVIRPSPVGALMDKIFGHLTHGTGEEAYPEDEKYPFSDLLRPESTSGWVSGPNPRFPLEIILDLRGQYILSGIEIVSHESMIASHVTLYSTRDEVYNRFGNWETIGFFKFNDNQRSQWKAREFKRIYINNVATYFLRIVISGCHVTPTNVQNRVSFVSFKITGLNTVKPKMTCYEDMMNDLVRIKMDAINHEKFGPAEDIKRQIDNGLKHADEIRHLFRLKEEAIQQEQYRYVDRYVSQILALLEGSHVPVPVSPAPRPSPAPQPVERPKPKPKPKPEPEPEPELEAEEEEEEKVVPSPPKVVSRRTIPEREPSPKKALPSTVDMVVGKPIEKRGMGTKQDEVEPLSDDARAHAEVLIRLFGENVVSTAYSSGWSLKVQGFEQICKLIKGLKSQEEKNAAIQNMFHLLRQGFNNGLKAVYVSTAEQFMSLMDEAGPSESVVFSGIRQILSIVLSKLNDTNQRIQETSLKVVLWSASKDKMCRSEILQFALKPPASQNQYVLITAKMEILKTMLGKEQSIKIPEAMGLIIPNLESRKIEVRQKAVEVFKVAHEVWGTKTERYLTKLPRLVKEQVMAAIGASGTD